MNIINVREAIINVLLQQADQRDVLINQLQTQITEFKKKYEPETDTLVNKA
jgi:hypothetical protein